MADSLGETGRWTRGLEDARRIRSLAEELGVGLDDLGTGWKESLAHCRVGSWTDRGGRIDCLARKSWNGRLAGEVSIRTDRWTRRLADGLGDWPGGIARSLKSWELDWTTWGLLAGRNRSLAEQLGVGLAEGGGSIAWRGRVGMTDSLGKYQLGLTDGPGDWRMDSGTGQEESLAR
jgi:hypothetical protein